MAISTAAAFDDSVIALMGQAFLVASADRIVVDQFVDHVENIGAKSIDITKYAKLSKATTPLTDGTDVTPSSMSDTKVTLTPLEYGDVVTNTRLASLQTGGKADLGAAKVVATQMVETMNALGCIAGEAGTNIRLANSAASEAAIVAADIPTDADLEYVHNRLYRSNIQRFDGDAYIAVCHPDVASEIKRIDGFEAVLKYASPDMLLKNEIGMYKGFRWISTAGMSINADAGADVCDTYHTLFLGRNAIGKATSLAPHLVYAPAGDKLNRLINVGWYAVTKYLIVDQDALWVLTSASGFGDNV